MMEVLTAIQNWYTSNCDSDWEHSYGIKITTLDNPGWAVHIALRETSLEETPFEAIELDRGEDDWVRCKIQDGEFCGWGGPKNLQEILELFVKFVEENSKSQ